MTSSPSNTTSSPPTNMTSTPSNTTSSPPTNTTSSPTNTTSSPTNTTSSPTNTTSSPPTNTTSSPPTNTTSSPPTNPTSLLTTLATTTVAPDPKLQLEFKIQDTFTPSLENKSSPEFKALEEKVTKQLDSTYSAKYGKKFNRTVVKRFSQGSIKADVELIFNDAETLPNTTSISNTLIEASSSSNFSFKVNTSTISVTAVTTVAPATTAPTATNATAPTATNASAPTATNATAPTATNATAPTATNATAPTATNATTAVATSASVTTAASSEGTLGLNFKLNRTFSSDLLNSSSAAYKTLASTITTEVNAACSKLYGSTFSRSIINSFSSGSIAIDMTLVYKDKSSVPSSSTATSQLSSALANSTNLNVIAGSVSAQSSAGSSQPTLISMSLLTLILLAITHILADV
ncbi:hypothetical protein NQD34_000863 [Periophthalmus magnuspinnatus]|nr:hypothetical protein NQD34_000863 [Periophthalmus magnuspinnatus]